MLDTLDVAQQLTVGGVERRQAEVIAKAIRAGAEQGDHVTSDQFKADGPPHRLDVQLQRPGRSPSSAHPPGGGGLSGSISGDSLAMTVEAVAQGWRKP